MTYDYGSVWLNEVYRPNQQIIIRNIPSSNENIKEILYRNKIKSQLVIFILLIIIIFILIKK